MMFVKFAAVLVCLAFCGVALAMAADKPETKDTAKSDKSPVQLVMKTSMGDIELELYPDKAPISVKNFLQYVDDGFYSGTIFHRVIKNFMIQGGGFDASMTQKKNREPIKNEAANGLKNEKGTLAYARTGIVDSATSQFFINTVDNNRLDYRDASPQGFGYCVFGKVIKGLDVVEKIQNVQTGTKNGFADVPVQTVEIKAIERVKK